MSIWKELTKPSSFVGDYNTSVAPPAIDPPEVDAPPAADEAPPPNGSLASDNKRESTLGPGVVIEGIIEGDGNMRIGGQIKGDIRLKGNLTLDAGALVVGGVNAASATIGGQVEGNVQSSGHVKLIETCQIVGDLKVKFLTVAVGSRMRGNVEFGWDEPVVVTVDKKKPDEQNATEPAAISHQEQDQPPDRHHFEEC